MDLSLASSSSSMMDCSNPLYLHNGDNPGSNLVSQLLTGENYYTWSRSMLMALTAKNKVLFINGGLPKPDASNPDFLPWTRCNNMVLSWIINSVSKEIGVSIICVDTAEAMWNDLKDRFSQQNGPRIFQIQKSISDLRQENLSVSNYFTILKGLWDELLNYRPLPPCTCGTMKVHNEYQQQEYVMQFLMGLNESYAHAKGQILMLNPFPPINKVFSLVIQEERQKEVSNSIGSINQNSSALFTKSVASTAPTPPRVAVAQPRFVKNTPFRKDRPTCSHCGISGHTMEKCYRLHGFPPGFKFTKGKVAGEHSANQVSEFFDRSSGNQDAPSLPFTQDQCQKLMALITSDSDVIPSANQVGHSQKLIANMLGNSIFTPISTSSFLHSVFSSVSTFQKASQLNNHPWILDTGATDHMICSISLFTTITASVSKLVRLPNGKFASVTHIGTVKISSTLTLTNVLCVPSFSFNLVSVSKLTKNISCCVLFLTNTCLYSASANMEDDWSG
jgi:hypothetical protein